MQKSKYSLGLKGMSKKYFPVLRTKAGEVDALSNLPAHAKERIFPIIRMTTTVPVTFQAKMHRDLTGFPIALDGANNSAETGSTAAFLTLLNGLGQGGVPVIPAVRIDDDVAYITTASSLIGQYHTGILVQCALADLNRVGAWIASQGWSQRDVYLIIEAGGVSELDPVSFGGYVATIISGAISVPHNYRQIALYSWSAPKDHGPLPRGRSLVPRRDWLLWNAVSNSVPFSLDYSDACQVHPSLEEIPGYVMATATVSVRYTIDDNWIVRKGVSTTGPSGQPMSTQYRNHAIALLAEPEFNAISNCWGDTRIRTYAASTTGSGGRPQWAAILLNRHISHVCDRLP
jgi:hypothetical protein